MLGVDPMSKTPNPARNPKRTFRQKTRYQKLAFPSGAVISSGPTNFGRSKLQSSDKVMIFGSDGVAVRTVEYGDLEAIL